MKTIKLELDFLIGPIIKDVFSVSKKTLVTGIDIVDNDKELSELNEKTSALYSSFYEFTNDEVCIFNIDAAKSHIRELSELILKIKDRLDLLNDGSFKIDDLVSDQLKQLE